MVARKPVGLLGAVLLGLLPSGFSEISKERIPATLSVASERGAARFVSQNPPASPGSRKYKYQVLATTKTSTMQKEMNEAATEGFRFEGVMGGETAFGGSETVVVMSKELGVESKANYEYKLLATSKTSTMQKELQQAGDEGFTYRGQTVFQTTFGGEEVVIILERDRDTKPERYEYKLLATSRTSTMQKELLAAGDAGFVFVGMTVSKTAFGGAELVVILRRSGAK